MPVGALSAGSRYGDDRAHGLIRTWRTTDAARRDGAQLPNLIISRTPAATFGPIPLTASSCRKSLNDGPRTYAMVLEPRHSAESGMTTCGLQTTLTDQSPQCHQVSSTTIC
jgi:hypothetical protein